MSKKGIHPMDNRWVWASQHPINATHKSTKTATFFKYPLEIKGPKAGI
jgi:hypothetical protein